MIPKTEVSFQVNGLPYCVTVEPRRLLVDVLRHDLGLTGTHVGCEHGVCGACSVIVDGAMTRACLVFAVQIQGARVETVEGLASGDELGEIQRTFEDKSALQCGFCTAGFLMLAKSFVARHTAQSDEQVRDVVSANLCRCTGYQQINAAFRQLADRHDSGELGRG